MSKANKKNNFSYSQTIPIEQQKIVLDRIKKNKENPSEMLSWEKAKKRLRQIM